MKNYKKKDFYMFLWLVSRFQSSGPEFDSGIRRLFPVLFFSATGISFGEGYPQVTTCTYFKLGTDKYGF